MSTTTYTAVTTAVPAGGFVTARITGRPADDRVTCPPALAGAKVGSVLLVTVSGGQMWATTLLGEPAAPVPVAAPVTETVTTPETATTTGTDTLAPVWTGAWRSGSFRQRTRRSMVPTANAGSGGICGTASTWSALRCRRCVSGSRISAC